MSNESQLPQIAAETRTSGLWEFLGVFAAAVFGFLGKIGWDRRPKKEKTQHAPQLSIHNLVLELKTTVDKIDKNQQDQKEQLIRMEERQVTKDALHTSIQDMSREVADKVGEVHSRLNDHIRDSHSKAA